MSLLKYFVCGVLVAASVVMADHKKHSKHAKKRATISQTVQVTEPAPATVGEPVVIGEPVVVDEGAPVADPPQTYPSMPGEVRTEINSTEVYTEIMRGGCKGCRLHKMKRGKAEIDELKGKARCTAEGLIGKIRYEVETEHVAPGQLDLVVQFRHRGRLLADEQGQPITLVIPLDHPTDADHDDHEYEYEGAVQMPLPMGHWGEIRLHGQVVDRASAAVLDRDRGKLELSGHHN